MNSGPLPLAAAAERLRGKPGRPRTRKPHEAASPLVQQIRRLLDLPTAAEYLGLSTWTLRDLEAAGTVTRVRIPLPRGGELRKLLFDRADLDRLVDTWKT